MLLAVAVAGIAIKMFVKKGGEFKKQCASINPQTGNRIGCTCEGAPSDGSCKNEIEKKTISPVLAQLEELQAE